MNAAERNVLIATAGLIITGVGAFLPWARIGGRDRSGFNTADTFIGLADGALPDVIAWVGRWWYLPAFLLFVCWATTFLAGASWLRVGTVALVVIALSMWWLFVWAGRRYGVLDTRLVGPVVVTAGSLLVGFSCAQRRTSVLRPGPTNQPENVV